MNNSIQIAILICSGLAALFVSSRNPRTRMFGFIAGLCGQPFWFITSWTNGQWAIVILACWYTFCHARGIWNNRKPAKEPIFDRFTGERLSEEPGNPPPDYRDLWTGYYPSQADMERFWRAKGL